MPEFDPRTRDGFTVPERIDTEGLTELEVARMVEMATRIRARTVQDQANQGYTQLRERLNALGSIARALTGTQNTYNDQTLNLIRGEHVEQNAAALIERLAAGLPNIDLAEAQLGEYKDIVARIQERGVDDVVAELAGAADNSIENLYTDLLCLKRSTDIEEVHFIFAEDEQANRRFGPGEIDNSAGHTRVVVLTPPIVIVGEGEDYIGNDVDGYEFHFGKFYLSLPVSDRWGGVQALPVTPRLFQGHFHPHVFDHGDICLGEGGAPITNAFRRGYLTDVVAVLLGVLRTYHADNASAALSQWMEGDQCPVCRGRVLEDDEEQRYRCPVTNVIIHRRCGRELDDQLVNPAAIIECHTCHRRHLEVDRRELTGGVSGCTECEPLIAEEQEHAEAGRYQCPNCREVHGEEEVGTARLTFGYRDYACTACVVQVREDVFTISGRDGRFRTREDSPENRTQYTREATPQPVVRVVCDCGERAPEHAMRTCMWTDNKICPHCDPDEIHMAPVFFEDTGYMEAFFVNFYATWMASIEPFVELYHPDGEEDLGELTYVVKQLRKWELHEAENIYDDLTTSLANKVDFWNNVVGADSPITIIYSDPEMERAHDEQRGIPHRPRVEAEGPETEVREEGPEIEIGETIAEAAPTNLNGEEFEAFDFEAYQRGIDHEEGAPVEGFERREEQEAVREVFGFLDEEPTTEPVETHDEPAEERYYGFLE